MVMGGGAQELLYAAFTRIFFSVWEVYKSACPFVNCFGVELTNWQVV